MQNSFLELGLTNKLKIERETPHGLFLSAQDGKEVLLPQAYVTPDMQIGELIDVFLYTDSEDRLIATTLTPKAKLDEFAFFEVVDVAKFGVFVDWNLPKDLLVPKKLQKESLKMGEKYFLKVVYDEKTHRLVATQKFHDTFSKKVKHLHKNQELPIVVIAKTPLGFKVLVDGQYEGILYKNEIFQPLNIGDELKAYIKNIRGDGKLDMQLKKLGAKNSSSATVVELLKANGGILPYNYKSDAEVIKEIFHMSKKEFKRSLTTLQNSGTIEVKDTGIYLKG